MRTPELTLVGAGPGDPELITLKGVKALGRADVVLYDALVHPDLLDYVPEAAQKIFVGKQVGRCEFSQHDINDLIVYHALHHGHVVRLKGGDPFVFGRGYEEITHAQGFGIQTSVIPGISSSISVPELQHIPLTCRGVSESFWVLTGTTRHHELSRDIAQAAQSSATALVLMGMKHLPQIVEIYQAAGKEDLPVAIIQNGSRGDEKVALGRITTIIDIVAEQGLQNPAIIVLGEVVALHPAWAVAKEQRQRQL